MKAIKKQGILTMRLSRRDFGKLALAAIPAVRCFGVMDFTFSGVRVGIGSASFRSMLFDEIIREMVAAPIGLLELEATFLEPNFALKDAVPVAPGAVPARPRGLTPEQREEQRQWRMTVDLNQFHTARKRLDDAGIELYAYSIPIADSYSSDEIDRVFQMAKALGVQTLNVVTTMPVVSHLIPLADQYEMRIGLHPSGMAQNPDSIGSVESYRKALALSGRFNANLDLAQNANWGPDPMAFVAEIHDRITTIHIHDRTTTGGVNKFVPFGQGQLPIAELLRLMHKQKYEFPVMVERLNSLDGADSLASLRQCIQYCKGVLA